MTTTIWDRNRLHVQVSQDEAGWLVFAGQDLNGWAGADEYEYWVKVPPEHLPRLLEALGGTPDDDLIGLVAANAAMIIRTGEATWVRSLGVTPVVSTWFD